jgi:hypothetical protein
MLINPKGSSSEKTTVFGYIEKNLYRIKGRPMKEIESNRVVENKEKVALKADKLIGINI